MRNPVARRQQETALDFGSARQVQPNARRRARGTDLIAAHQARTGAVQPSLRRHVRQGYDDAAGRAVLYHLAARGLAQIQHDPRALGVAAEADAGNLTVRPKGQAAPSRQHDGANHDEGQARHRPFTHAPTGQIVTPPAIHGRTSPFWFRRQDERRD
ncbi:hypothetical protein D3C80_764790 [compost metagenome]